MASTRTRNLIRLFSFIYLLNCLDLLFTYTYVKIGDFYEMNPLLRPIIHQPISCLVIKVILPGILLIYLFTRLKALSPSAYAFFKTISLIVLTLYICVNLTHLYYLFFYVGAFSL